MMESILIVEDDITYGLILKAWLRKKGFDVSTESNVARAKKHLEAQPADLVLSDLRLPDNDGVSLLGWMKQKGMNAPFIIMTSYADIQSAIQAIRMGAKEYITKPVNPDELLMIIRETLQSARGTAAPTAEAGHRPGKDFLEGESDAAKQLYGYVSLVAPTNMAVLIHGASGTGKEYVAQRIHQLSGRKDKPFVPVDCGSVPKELAASEFFGHVKGAFTGALTDKTGTFAAANGGTVFLDEIGNLGYEVQVQLLRALQERKVRPVGSGKEIDVDIRLISATNENLEDAIGKGAFREDLFHRINEFTLHIPRLKDRHEDILLFANFFLDQANKELNKRIAGFDAGASAAIREYHWPGNLRQMKNMIRRATLLAAGEFITPADLGNELSEPAGAPAHNISLRNGEAEKEQILEALRQTGNNKSKAAGLLDIDRKTLYNKLKRYGLDR